MATVGSVGDFWTTLKIQLGFGTWHELIITTPVMATSHRAQYYKKITSSFSLLCPHLCNPMQSTACQRNIRHNISERIPTADMGISIGWHGHGHVHGLLTGAWRICWQLRTILTFERESKTDRCIWIERLEFSLRVEHHTKVVRWDVVVVVVVAEVKALRCRQALMEGRLPRQDCVGGAWIFRTASQSDGRENCNYQWIGHICYDPFC